MQIPQMLSFVSFASLLLLKNVYATVYSVPNAPYDGTSVAEYTALADELDGQKVKPYPDSNSYEWWYFDAVSTSSSNESVTIIFFETLNSAFPTFVEDSYLSVALSGTYEDGTIFNYMIPLGNTSTDVATITTTGDGASGVWGETGFSFTGTSDLSSYTVNIDSPSLGISGTVILNTVSPPHYPCSGRTSDANELLFPHVGWANAIPDSDAIIDININGTALTFTGLGYHDKNWGDEPFTNAVQSWYWGHGRLGPYSIVWFDALDNTGAEYVSGYVTENGQIVGSVCSAGSVVVRPYGANSDYPPTVSSGVPEGFKITFDLGDAGVFDITAVTGTIQIPGGSGTAYGRYLGSLSGTLAGETYTGTALWEQFKF